MYFAPLLQLKLLNRSDSFLAKTTSNLNSKMSTCGCIAGRQNIQGDTHFLWPSSPSQTLGSSSGTLSSNQWLRITCKYTEIGEI